MATQVEFIVRELDGSLTHPQVFNDVEFLPAVGEALNYYLADGTGQQGFVVERDYNFFTGNNYTVRITVSPVKVNP